MKNNNNSKKQICNHPFFYTIDYDVYCNECHEYLGYFDPWKLRGFIKQTKDTIADSHLNKRTVKVDIPN